MNQLIIMTIPDTEKPFHVYDKTLRRSASNQSYKTYEEAKQALDKLLQTGGYIDATTNPDGNEEFKNLFNKFKKKYVKPDDDETGGHKRF
jgi:hypothetical protein